MSGKRAERALEIEGDGLKAPISGLWLDAPTAGHVLALAHGAGAGMRHAFMQTLAERLLTVGVATLRYEFPYITAGKKRPDPKPLLLASVRAAVTAAVELAGERPVFAGGKSMGGRMTSMAAAEAPLPAVQSVVFFGFPLHPAKDPRCERAVHLARVAIPMLFLQGTRDDLAELPLMRSVHADLARADARLHVVEGADHGFGVLKRSGRTDSEVLGELVRETRLFFDEVAGKGGLE